MPHPAPAPGAFQSPEARLASWVIQLVSILRKQPGYFAPKYAEVRPVFWGSLMKAERLCHFGSDFFSELLEVTRHPVAQPDVTPERRAKLRSVEQLLVLRRLQGGDLRRGLAAARELAGEPGGVPPGPAASEATPDDPWLSSECLQGLADRLRAREPRAAEVLDQLVPLLVADPTYTAGAGVSILLHLTSGGTQSHPGYGVIMGLRSDADVLDHGLATRTSLNGLDVAREGEFGRAMSKALEAADNVSRSSGGRRLDRGLDFRLQRVGFEDLLSGESASLAFALLDLSDGRTACDLERLVPHPGTAATGVVEADGLIRDVAQASLAPKLTRAWESGVRRVYVPAGQQARCAEIVAGLSHAYQGSTAGEEVGGDPGRIDPGGLNPGGLNRWVSPIGARRLEEIALPHHFASARRPVATWLRRFARRNRIWVEVGAGMFVLALAGTTALLWPRHLTHVTFKDGVVSVRYSPWGNHSAPLEVEGGYARPPDSASLVKWGDFDGDGREEIYLLSMHTEQPDGTTGEVRVDCLSAGLGTIWRRQVDSELRFGTQPGSYPTNMLGVQRALFEDWNGDGKPEILVVSTHLYFPSVLTIWDLRGGKLLEFVNAGHISDICLVPPIFALAAADSGASAATPTASPAAASSPAAVPTGRGIALLAHSQGDSSCLFAYLPPGAHSGASPTEIPRLQYAGSLPLSDGIFIKIPPSADARRGPAGRNWPDRVEYLPGPPPRIKLGTVEIPGTGTLLRYFDHRLEQVQVASTDAFLAFHRRDAGPLRLFTLDSEEFRKSLETLRYLMPRGWVAIRHPAWGTR